MEAYKGKALKTYNGHFTKLINKGNPFFEKSITTEEDFNVLEVLI